jgi:hypothetical protein
MHQLFKLTPLLLGAVSLSACSALGFGANQSTAQYGNDMSGTYTQVAANTQNHTVSDYDINSGWYAGGSSTGEINPYAGGEVQLDIQPTDIYPDGNTQMAHNGYHDAYGNPVPGPMTQTQPVDTTYVTPSLRGSYGPSYYGNIGATMYDVGDEIFGIVGRLGVEKDWYGAELEGTIGVIDEDIGGIDVGVDHSLAAFAVGRLPVGNRLKALGRVGYHTTQVGAMDNNGDSASADFDGIAYGAGVEYDLNPVSGLRLDYTRYDLEEATSDSLAATYIRRF